MVLDRYFLTLVHFSLEECSVETSLLRCSLGTAIPGNSLTYFMYQWWRYWMNSSGLYMFYISMLEILQITSIAIMQGTMGGDEQNSNLSAVSCVFIGGNLWILQIVTVSWRTKASEALIDQRQIKWAGG